MRFVIPSFNRPNIIKEKTLKFLALQGIKPSEIDIVVEDEPMKEEYIKSLGMRYRFIVSGTKGVGEKRNFIRSYYREETKLEEIVCFDDDIDNVIDIDKPLDIRSLISKSFIDCKNTGVCLWGVSPLHNPFFLKHAREKSYNLKYISGAFFGLKINRNKYMLHTDIDHGEDFQFSMEHFLRDKAVLRWNRIYVETKYFEEQGGICESLGGLANRKIQMIENSKYLNDRYEDMCSLKIKKYGYDIKLNPYYKIKID